jgi:hypothetical protein
MGDARYIMKTGQRRLVWRFMGAAAAILVTIGVS